MTDPSRSVGDDPELVELFRDDPGGLAIIDAIAATQRQRRRRMPGRGLAVAAVVIVIAVAVGALTRAGSHAGVVERARAALPTNRVLRIVLEDERPAASVVDLATGHARPAPHMVTEWFDLRSGLIRVRDRVGVVTVSDVRIQSIDRPASIRGGFSQGVISRFPVLYRRALAQATNADVTRSTLDDAPVFWLKLRRSQTIEAVAIDPHTYRPTLVIFRNGRGTRRFRVTTVETLPTSTRVPTVGQVPRLRRSGVTGSRPITSTDARAQNWLTSERLGEVAFSLPIQSIREIDFNDGSSAAELLYGSSTANGRLPTHFIRVQESFEPEALLGWSPALVGLARPGLAVIEQAGAYTNAYLRRSGRFIRIYSSEGQANTTLIARRIAGG
jgi:hypothetical protein